METEKSTIMNSNLKALAQIFGMIGAPKESASNRRTRKRRIISRPPISMSEGTAYLYNRKPNLAWWQQKYGENILDKSLAELHSMGI